MHNAGALLPELINSGIRVLIYAGQADSSTSSYLILWYPLTYFHSGQRGRLLARSRQSAEYLLYNVLDSRQEELHRLRWERRWMDQGGW